MAARRSGDVPLVGVIMGSQSDWDTLSHTVDTLQELAVAIVLTCWT